MIYDLGQLRSAYQQGQELKYMFFWGHTPPSDGRVNQSCFSQFWICRFNVEGDEYACAEQYMMAEKARMFQDEAMLTSIMKAKKPVEMKAFGRAVKGFDREAWERSCYEIVKRGNLAKFSQNPELADYLMTTGEQILVEASPTDRIWGIGMAQDNPEAGNPLGWRGKNLLGFALMEVRDALLKRRGD